MRTVAVAASLLVVGLLVACSGSDDVGTARQQAVAKGAGSNGSGSGSSTPSSSQSSSSSNKDAGADTGPDYRDPRASDGACSAPNTVCGSACVSLTTDIANCGACGKACQGGGTQCVGATCTCTLQTDRYCDDAQGTGCRDVASDFNNCGSCGNACDPNVYDRCEGGKCLEPC